MRAYCYGHKDYVAGCPECRARSSRRRRAVRAAVAAGTWDSAHLTADELEQVRQHVRGLLGVPGVTGERINTVAGVGPHSISRLVGSRRRTGRTVAEALLGVTAAACLALPVEPTSWVPLAGASRRLRALAVDGWSTEEIAGLTGINVSMVRRHRLAAGCSLLTFVLHEKYRLLYDKIQSLTDPRGSSAATGRQAQARGWLGPERWADEDLDIPDALPLPPAPDTDDWVAVTALIDDALRDPRPGKAAGYPRDIQREIARQASGRLGWSYTRIAELLGKSGESTVEYLLHGRKDRPSSRGGKDACPGRLSHVASGDAPEAVSVL